MKPSDKARELIKKYYTYSTDYTERCTLICVDEILLALLTEVHEPDALDIIYWRKVKDEIEKL